MATPEWNPAYIKLELTDLESEWYQCRDEGKIVPRPLRNEFERLRGADLTDPAEQAAMRKLFDACAAVEVSDEFDYVEPSAYEEILKVRPPTAPELPPFDIEDGALLADRLRGAWLGRSAGCLLGIPVEGWAGDRLEEMLRATGRYPLAAYLRLSDADDEARKKFEIDPNMFWADAVERMPADDDMNYSLIGLGIMQKYGANFTPLNVAEHWLTFLPPWRTFTAERVAMRNFMLGMEPPQSAIWQNPYREWIGAQIRADFFGWAGAGAPELAARWAWTDACISHVKNGIYGEMWAAAMMAAAAVCKDPVTVLRAGLAQIPEWCRLARAVANVIGMYKSKYSFEEFVADHRRRREILTAYHRVHTIVNAELVAAALLWGEGDFGRSISMAVQPGYDTDCNGATVGSVLGMMYGAAAIGAQWRGPLGDGVSFTLAGTDYITYDKLVADSVEVITRCRHEAAASK